MKLYVAIQSSDLTVYVVRAAGPEEAYRTIGRAVYGMTDPIDTGNVDVDLYEVPPVGPGGTRKLQPTE